MPVLFLQAPHGFAQGLNTHAFLRAGICSEKVSPSRLN